MANNGVLPLFIHNKKIFSDYQLIGRDENALTYALGHCLSLDREFLSSFLRRCQFKSVTRATVGHAEIHLQKGKQEAGIVDLEIFIPDRLQLIVEAKVDEGYPTTNQIQTYVKRLDRGLESKVVVLTKITDEKIRNSLRHQFKKKIGFLAWSDIMELSQNLAEHDDSTFQLQDFSAFMEEVYAMRINAEEEVWIVPLSTKWKAKSKDISVAELHIKHAFWVMGDRRPRRAIYMGFRYDGYLQYFGRIKKIEYERKSSQIGPKIAEEFWSKKYKWDVIRLDNLIPFPKRLRSGNIYNKHIYCDLDLLLTANSILEAATLMRERRAKKNSDKL